MLSAALPMMGSRMMPMNSCETSQEWAVPPAAAVRFTWGFDYTFTNFNLRQKTTYWCVVLFVTHLLPEG